MASSASRTCRITVGTPRVRPRPGWDAGRSCRRSRGPGPGRRRIGSSRGPAPRRPRVDRGHAGQTRGQGHPAARVEHLGARSAAVGDQALNAEVDGVRAVRGVGREQCPDIDDPEGTLDTLDDPGFGRQRRADLPELLDPLVLGQHHPVDSGKGATTPGRQRATFAIISGRPPGTNIRLRMTTTSGVTGKPRRPRRRGPFPSSRGTSWSDDARGGAGGAPMHQAGAPRTADQLVALVERAVLEHDESRVGS
jgi:hypothetical protein